MIEELLQQLIERLDNRYYGKYRGYVSNVTDPQNTGRIKAKVPSVLGDQETGWCTPCVPYAGDQAGIAFLPEEHAGVWIEFEGGDVSYPIWVGCYWHDGEIPSRVKPDVKVITTRKNRQIVLDESANKIEIKDRYNTITLDNDGITIVRGSGKLVVKDGNVTVNDGAMEVT